MFGATEQVSHALQTKNTMLQEALSSAKMAEAMFKGKHQMMLLTGFVITL